MTLDLQLKVEGAHPKKFPSNTLNLKDKIKNLYHEYGDNFKPDLSKPGPG